MKFVCKSRLQCVTFKFMLGHAGVRGNERADCIASKDTLVVGRQEGNELS